MRFKAPDVVLAAGGAALNAFLSVLFDRMASKRFVDFITRQKQSDRLLPKLKTAMNSVRGVLDDEEGKEITRPAVKQWLDDLKNAFLEAEDLMDEIDYDATGLELEAESRSAIDEIRKFVCPRKSCKKGLKARLMEIVETIEDLVKQKDALGLTENIGGGESTQRIPSTSLVETSDIFGREQDQKAIMEMLFSDDVNRSNKLSIISIVGLGGIGKTTLAQLIYRDRRVQNRFKVRGWVCVSEEFDVPEITRDIAKEVAQVPCDDKTLNQIQVELGKKLTGKRFLLVLDDVWNGSLTDWDILLKPLKSGVPGSKIIITTRNDGVATTVAAIVSSSSIFHLHKLAFTESWKLFKHAFDDKNSHDYPHLEEIGKGIVKRCDGLPLAVRVMGGVLRSVRNVKDWENVLRNDMWEVSKDGILPVLRLSYRYLPSHLKQCFAYCSIFPKDYEFEKEELILLWMAEDFLIEKENKTMEEVGEEYFKELVSRSFFQHVNNSFVMHDLINDLARVLAGDFCFRFENQDSCRTFERLRYFSCAVVKEESSSRQLSTIFKSHLLRTFLPVYNIEREKQGQTLQEMIPDLFLNQGRLRVLSLSRFQNVVNLPSSISHLKHLRYLNLSRTSIESLPECLCSFHNLQTLKLSGCKKLAKLPTKMGRMISMLYLDIEGTNLQEMPPNMGKLIKLQKLTDFFVGMEEDCGVKELGSLQHLGGTLRIHNLQNVVNAKDALEAEIKCKKNLKKLYLYWEGDSDDPYHKEVVLDGLEPHTEIEVISIDGYGGTSFPNWLESGELLCLKELWVINCQNLKGSLPSHLSSLPKLVIRNSPQLQNCVPHVPNLSSQESSEEITIAEDESLECFSLEAPKLKSLRIEKCPNFESLCTPNQEFVSFEFLTQLILEDCPKLKFLPENMHLLLPALLELEISRCPEIETFPRDGLPLKLQSLVISNCDKLIAGRANWDLQKLTSLTSFSIMDYEAEEMEFFLEVTLLPSVLTSLGICNLRYLKSLNYEGLKHFDSLERLIIQNCPRLQLVPDEDAHFAHRAIRDYANFDILFNRRFHDITSLRELQIWDCPEIASIPEEGLPPSLITLGLYNLQNLSFVEGLRHLTSLESLTISNCPHLETLSEEGLPSSLSSLRIWGCPLLEKSSQWN